MKSLLRHSGRLAAVAAAATAGGSLFWSTKQSPSPAPAPAWVTETSAGKILQTSPVISPLAFESDFDLAVVGAGIVGLAVAREVQKRYPQKRIVVLEKLGHVGGAQTSHNSNVIHAGIYYVPGSVMAETCVKGASLMYDYCSKKGIPYERCGKLIVAADATEHVVLEQLLQRGTANGVKGLQLLTGAEAQAMEPNIRCYSALWSPNTGIVDYSVVAKSISHELLSSKKADVRCLFDVQGFQLLQEGSGAMPQKKRVEIRGLEPGQRGPMKSVRAANVITCAGLYSDRVSQMAGGAPEPKVVAFRGTYYQLKEEFKNIVRTNVYPVPSGGGIPVGVHLTPTINESRGHQMIVGPGASIAFSKEGYKFSDVSLRDLADYALNGGLWRFALANPSLSLGELYKDLNKQAFLKSAQKLCPSITADMVESSFSGVMGQIFEPDGSASKDYIFERGAMEGTVLNVRSTPSPACTASFAIAEKVVDIAERDFGWGSHAATAAASATAPATSSAAVSSKGK